MKITCANKNIKDAVSIAERNTSKNQTLPILNSIWLGAENNTLIIRATNLETALEIKIPCKVETAGDIVVSGKILNGFLSQINDEQIFIQNQKNSLLIKTQSTQTTLRGYPTDDFPLFPSIEPLFSFNILADELGAGLENVVIAASTSDIKPELASIFFKIFKNTLKLAATDSFRLAEYNIISKKLNSDKEISFLIPSKSIQELIYLFDSSKNSSISSLGMEKDLEIILNKNQIIFKNKNIRFISRLTEGMFPEYDQIIPKNFKTEAVVKKSEIMHHIKLSSIFVSRLNDLGLIFDPDEKKIIFQSSNPDTGEHNSELSASIQGEKLSAKFNWRYLLDGIGRIQNEYIILGFNGDQSPLMIRCKGDNSYLYLAMPMRGI